MLLRYFGFKEDPFGATPDSRFLYHSHTHREALASLQYGFYCNRGFTALIAPPGMGKTTLLFRFLEDIRASARSAFLFDSQCEPQELVGYILRDIGITPGPSNAERHEQLNRTLIAEARAGRQFVVVIDEAQNLSEAALEMVRLLTNFETPRAKLMQIVLSGQPKLAAKLMQPSLEQLRQRISTLCRLEPFSTEEITAYIGHRVKLAGYCGAPLFTEHALNLITEESRGIPRTINNLCFNALSLCCARQRKRVDGSMVAEAIADQRLVLQPRQTFVVSHEAAAGQSRERKQLEQTAWLPKLWVPALAALLVMSVVVIDGLVRSHKTRYVRSAQTDVLPASLPAPVEARIANTESIVEPHSKTASFEITVESKQTLGDIAVRYLGSFDSHLLHEMQMLNPKMVDPNLIQPGQKIRLPKPPPLPTKDNVTLQGHMRNLP